MSKRRDTGEHGKKENPYPDDYDPNAFLIEEPKATATAAQMARRK